jgi:dihydropteroate synthase
MSEHNPETIDIKTLNDAKKEIKKIGSDKESIDIMAPKAISKAIKLKNLILQDAIIIKQDMLSIGGEVAVPRNTFELNSKKADILVIGTINQHRILVKKLKRHYNRLKKVAIELENTIKDFK